MEECNVLFVCTGNTCRSPVAEALAKAKAAREGRNIAILSAGLHAIPGTTVSEHAFDAIRSADSEALPYLEAHVPRQAAAAYIEAADFVVTMTEGQKRQLIHHFPGAESKTRYLGELAGENVDVIDPFGGDASVYEACVADITRLLAKAWHKFKAED